MRRVGRMDKVEAQSSLAQKVEGGAEVAADELDFLRFVQPFFGAFFAAGLSPAALPFALPLSFDPGSSFKGLAGLGLAEDFSTGPLAGSSATSASSLPLAAFLGLEVAFLALGFAVPP